MGMAEDGKTASHDGSEGGIGDAKACTDEQASEGSGEGEGEGDSHDRLFVHSKVERGEGYHVIRTRPGQVEIGELREMQPGKPISGEVVKLTPTEDHDRVFDVEVESCVRDEEICMNSGDNSPGQPGGKKGFDINVLNFVGTGVLDGVEVDVDGRLIDCGEPQGKKSNDPDQFEIYVNGSEFVADVLGGGNVQLHPPVGKP